MRNGNLPLSFGIAVVFAIAIPYFVRTIYPLPEYQSPEECREIIRCDRPATVGSQYRACFKDALRIKEGDTVATMEAWKKCEELMDRDPGYQACREAQKKCMAQVAQKNGAQNMHDPREAYTYAFFFILLAIAILALLGGAMVHLPSAVRAGLISGAVLLILGTLVYAWGTGIWESMSGAFRATLLGLLLATMIFSGYMISKEKELEEESVHDRMSKV